MVDTKVKEQPLDKESVQEQIIETIISEGMVDREKVSPDATLESLELESFEVVMILTALEDKFDVYIPVDGPLTEAETVEDFISGLADQILKEQA